MFLLGGDQLLDSFLKVDNFACCLDSSLILCCVLFVPNLLPPLIIPNRKSLPNSPNQVHNIPRPSIINLTPLRQYLLILLYSRLVDRQPGPTRLLKPCRRPLLITHS